MLWVLKRTVLIRAPKTYVKTDEYENIYNFTLKNFVYLNLWCSELPSHKQAITICTHKLVM